MPISEWDETKSVEPMLVEWATANHINDLLKVFVSDGFVTVESMKDVIEDIAMYEFCY